MVFNRFFLFILLRVGLLFGAITAFSLIFLRPDLLFTQIILGTIIIIQIGELTHFVNRTNYDLSRFLAAIKDNDFSINFSNKEKIPSYRSLNASFSQLIETLKELETEKEAQFHFLNQLVNQIEFGIITFDEQENIELINKQACDLLSIPKVGHWKNLKNPNLRILYRLLQLEDGKNQLIENRIANQDRYFSVSVTTITIRDQHFKIVSFQDIRSEIQQKEIEAWHKLIRILTHEIMNSVTPLVSLTETIQMILLNDETGKVRSLTQLNDENIEDVSQAVETIRDRGEGILKFVQDYRKLTRIPKPEIEKVEVQTMISEVTRLMQSDMERNGVGIISNTEQDSLSIDPNLIQQVMINLLKNAKEALIDTEKPVISIESEKTPEFFKLHINDNGPGIPVDRIDRIFVPFYTTKPEGSGIGLSVSRQILNLHGGFLEVHSEPGDTTFTMAFPVRNLV